MEKTQLISTDMVQEALTDALRRLVGKGKPFSVSALAEAAGVSEKTVYAIREGSLIPSFETLLRFAAVLPESFMSEIIAPAGLGGVERIDAADVDAHAVLADIAAECANISNRLQDGVFCHRDRAVTAPELAAFAHRMEAAARMFSGKPALKAVKS